MKIDFITLRADNTATMKKCKTKGTKVLVSRKWQPEFTEGRSVFPLTIKHFFGLIKQTKKVIIAVEGAEKCLEFQKGATKLAGSSWKMKELKEFVGKLVHLSLVTQKPFSNLQAFFLFGLMAANTVMTLLMLRRIGF
jgi:hypothetical protein